MTLTAALGRRLGQAVRVVNLAAAAGHTLLGLDTSPVPRWDHVSKVDPESDKQLPLAFPLFLSETGAISVGGSRDVTAANTEETMELVDAVGVPVIHEPSGPDHVTEGTRGRADHLAIPEVLNGDSEALVGTLGRGLDYVRGHLAPAIVEEHLSLPLHGEGFLGRRLGNFAAAYLMETALFEAYIVMNPDSAAARESGVTEADLLSPQVARERALAAEYHLDSEVVYLEYSGTFGGDEAVEILTELDDALSSTRLWYGGGLDSADHVEAVRDAGADTVVVGDVFHEIADLEAELLLQAAATFDGVPEHDQLRGFVEETVDVEETSAARYLSTVPAVTDPTETATEYLAAGVELGLVTAGVAADLGEPSRAAFATAVQENEQVAATRMASLLGDDRLPRRLAATVLADRFDVALADGFTARHLAVELPL